MGGGVVSHSDPCGGPPNILTMPEKDREGRLCRPAACLDCLRLFLDRVDEEEEPGAGVIVGS